MQCFLQVINNDRSGNPNADSSPNLFYLHPPHSGVSLEKILGEFRLMCFTPFNETPANCNCIMLKCKKCGFYFAKSCDRKAASIINLLFAPQRLPAHTRARNPQTLSAHLRTLIIQSALGAKSSCQAWWEFYSIFFCFWMMTEEIAKSRAFRPNQGEGPSLPCPHPRPPKELDWMKLERSE